MADRQTRSEGAERLGAQEAVAFIDRALKTASRPLRICIKAFNPGGLSGHHTVEITGLHCGIDWDAGKIILQPARPLTWLRPEDVDAVHKRAKEGQSWHAYQQENRRLAQLGQALGTTVTTFSGALREIERLRAAAGAGHGESEEADPAANSDGARTR